MNKIKKYIWIGIWTILGLIIHIICLFTPVLNLILWIMWLTTYRKNTYPLITLILSILYIIIFNIEVYLLFIY